MWLDWHADDATAFDKEPTDLHDHCRRMTARAFPESTAITEKEQART